MPWEWWLPSSLLGYEAQWDTGRGDAEMTPHVPQILHKPNA